MVIGQHMGKKIAKITVLGSSKLEPIVNFAVEKVKNVVHLSMKASDIIENTCFNHHF